MCYRYVLQREALDALETRLGIVHTPDWRSRYNIAPGEAVPVVRQRAASDVRSFEVVRMRWGFQPAWARNAAPATAPANARSEGLAGRPMFRDAFRRRRCIVPAGGFYEWRGEGGRRQPYLCRLRDGGPLCFAGLWEYRQGPGEEPAAGTCAIITAPPNELIRPIHDRMPAILAPEDIARWLDPRMTEPRDIEPLLRPFPAGAMTAVPVTTRVNNIRFDEPACLEPEPAADDGEGPAQLPLGL